VLVVELMGLSAVLPYGFLLVRYTGSAGSRGLPLDDGRVVLPADKCFHVRVLVPCYKVGGWVEGGGGECKVQQRRGCWPPAARWVDGLGKMQQRRCPALLLGTASRGQGARNRGARTTATQTWLPAISGFRFPPVRLLSHPTING
jgi:hypothetical protein